MKLNVGAGDVRVEGYLSIDLRSDVADVVAPADHLPYPDNSIEEILASDILEHFPATETANVLAEWHRVLIKGGLLTLRVPNMVALALLILTGSNVEAFIRNIYGGHRFGPEGAWDTHHTGWTPDLLAAALTVAGFTVMHNDCGVNMTIRAVRT